MLLPDSSRAAGVIVVATGAVGAVVARALSNENGEFDLRLPRVGRYQLRALRIGFRPTVVPDIEIAAGEVRTVVIILGNEAIVLATVTVRGQTVCHVPRDTGQMVAHLWEEARKAITATELSPAGATQTVRWTTYDRATDLSGKALWEKDGRFSAAAVKAFVSLPPDSLAKLGYRSEDADGIVYRAPDAEALLSDAFVSLHCFRVEPPRDHTNDWVGIGFSPARNRADLVDIEGTLWLDRTSSELRLLEFQYTNLPDEEAHVQAGGRVEFLRVATGRWLVSRWQLRLPRLRLKHVTGFHDEQIKMVADGLQFSGGEVTAVQRGTEVLFSSGESAHDDSPAQRADDEKLALTCAADSTNGELASLLRGTVFDGAHHPVAGASVRITWRGEYTVSGAYSFSYRDEERDLVSSASGDWSLCPVPRERVITVRAMVGNRVSAPVAVRIPKDRSWAVMEVELPVPRP